ncbi:hypothetical protein FACS1894147_11780 [Spirochaetia bacterium]|nr:hypothetical protein FACS1894147_11780 [Spirochaetia bacterium]
MYHADPLAGAYVFQGDSLLIPDSIADSQISEAVPLGRIYRDFPLTAVFTIPRVEGQGTITGVDIPAAVSLSGWRAVPMREALSLLTSGIVDGAGPVGRILRAYHIAQWRRDSVFCGACGTRNGDAPTELARLCPRCGRMEFPRICPAIITIIINNKGEALLAHNKKFAPGVYSLIAGFNEAGENLEATVVREVEEEVGIAVNDVQYIASQPWPFPNSLMLGFCARHASGQIMVDNIEIEDARWFTPETLPKLPGSGSVSRYLINRWLEGSLPSQHC